MKLPKWCRFTTLLFCMVMLMGFFFVDAPEVHASEPDWPYLKSIDEYTFRNEHLRSDFPAPENNLKKIEIQHKSEAVKCSNYKDSAPMYDVGTIVLYVETLPTEADKDPATTANYCGFKFQIARDASNNAKITISGEYEKLGNFKVTHTLKVGENFYDHKGSTYYYIQTADGTRYHYDVKVVPYVEETDELKLASGSAVRNSKEQATVTFTSTQPGSYYYGLYDSQQTGLTAEALTASGGEMIFGTNTLTLTGLPNSAKRYLYIVGKTENGSASDILEIAIPGNPFKLQHEKQGLRGFVAWEKDESDIVAGWLYTEEFKDASGNTISEAVPGEQVTVNFGAFAIKYGSLGDTYYDSENSAIAGKYNVHRHVLKKWNITGVENLSPGKETSFTFTMPENDVTIQAETELSGVPVYLTSDSPTVSASLECMAWLSASNRYSATVCNYSDGKDWIIAGTSVKLRARNIADGYVSDKWVIANNGAAVDESKISHDEDGNPILTVEEGGDYVLKATFREKKFASVTAEVNDSTMGAAKAAVGDGEASGRAYPVYEGQSVTLTATPGERYLLDKWEVKDADGTVIAVTPDEADANKATFTMPDTGKNITATAIFKADPSKASDKNELLSVALCSADGKTIGTVSTQGTARTITLPADTDVSQLSAMLLKLTASDYAAITKSGDSEAKDWTSGQPCGMVLNEAAVFTVTAENGDTQDYTITITKVKSSEKEITEAVLLNSTEDTTPLASAAISGTSITFTLPENTDKSVLNSITTKYLKLTYPASASAAMKDGYSDASGTWKWRKGDVMCNLSLNTPTAFTVTAEDGSTKDYTVKIEYTAPNAPTLSAGSAARTGKTGATVKFTSSEAGSYFYKAVAKDAAVPTIDTTGSGTAANKGENTLTLSNLTEDARDLYVVVKNASGAVSEPLKVAIPAYSSEEESNTGAYSITISAPKGGTLTTNRSKADKGDSILVTVTPDSGYQMAEGSLTYTLAVAGGETKTITGNRFTMPAGDVTITCKWETASVTFSGITAFTINGVNAAVNHTTNRITMTLPYGTDVTKLVPVISANGVKSLTPGSGERVDFSDSVTYTAVMEDGSTKIYTVTVYVEEGTLSDQFWDKLTDFYNQVPWWEYAQKQQSTKKYPKYW